MLRRIWMMIMIAMVITISVTMAEAEDVVVHVWHTYNATQLEAMQSIADEFNESHPGVTVLLEEQPSDGFMDSVYTAIANHNGPDIIFNFATTAADFVDGGLVANMDTYMDIEAYKLGVPEGVYTEAVGFSDEHVHIIAIQMTGPVLFYNKAIFDELELKTPETWDELAECAVTIYQKKGIAGLVVDSVCDLIQTRMMQAGSDYVDVANRCVSFDRDITVDIFNWFADCVQAGGIETNLTGEYGYVDLNSGLAAMYIGSCGAMPSIANDAFDVGVMSLPQDGTVNWYPAWNRGGIVFSSTPEKEQAAVDFLTFLTSDKNSVKWCMTLGALSPRLGAINDPDYFTYVEADPALIALTNSLDYVGYIPSIPGIYTTRNAVEKAALQVAGGLMTAEEAFDQAVAEANAILGQ